MEEIPPVVAVVPRSATDIVIACSGELLVSKTICISTEVGCTAGHRLVVEIIVAVHILNRIVAALLHLTSGVRRTVDVKVLEQAIGTFAIEVILARPSNRKVFDMDVQRVGMHGNAARAVSHLVEVQQHFIPRIAGNDDAFGGRTSFVDAELVREFVRSFA